MKRTVTFMLVLFILLSFTACSSSADDLERPVAFYYCNNLESEDDFENVFIMELHEGVGYEDNRPALLSLYLAGPVNERYISPFPSGLKIISIKKENTNIQVVLSDEISELTGLDLILACTCLSKTIFGLYPCDRVTIAAATTQLDNRASITIRKETLVLTDHSYPLVED